MYKNSELFYGLNLPGEQQGNFFPCQILDEEIHSATSWVPKSRIKLVDFLVLEIGKIVHCMWPSSIIQEFKKGSCDLPIVSINNTLSSGNPLDFQCDSIINTKLKNLKGHNM